jgi:hypothetical protein
MRLHHVNLAVHPDLLEAEMQFLADGLGLLRLDPGPELADRARWYEFPDGTQVHLSRTTDPSAPSPVTSPSRSATCSSTSKRALWRPASTRYANKVASRR